MAWSDNNFLAGFAFGYTEEHKRLSLLSRASAPAPRPPEEDSEVVEEVDQGFILEVVERANDRFLARLDALDTLLVGLLAASLAISGLVIDRYTDLGHGLWPLGVAYVACAFGLLFGNAFCRPRDAPNPRKAIIGLNSGAETGLVELSAEIAGNWQRGQWRRFDGYKKSTKFRMPRSASRVSIRSTM